MIVRIARVKVGHCQAPMKKKPDLDEVGLFCFAPLQLESGFAALLRPKSIMTRAKNIIKTKS
jgi:hypothetical protein